MPVEPDHAARADATRRGVGGQSASPPFVLRIHGAQQTMTHAPHTLGIKRWFPCLQRAVAKGDAKAT